MLAWSSGPRTGGGRRDLGAGLSRVFSASAAVTLRLLRLVLYLIREPAEFIENVRCVQGQIAQTIGRIAEERRGLLAATK